MTSNERHPFRRQNVGRMYKWTLGLLILFAMFLAYTVFSPFLTPIILAAVLAAIFFPLFTRISERLGGRDAAASVVVLFIVVFCVFLPTVFFLSGLVSQGATSINELNNWIKSPEFKDLVAKARLEPALAWLHEKMPFLELGAIDFQAGLVQFSRNVGQTLISMGTSILGNAVAVFMDFLIMLFVLFFLLKDGRRIIDYVKYLSPLHEDQEDVIIANLRNVSRAVLVGGLMVALLQGVAGGVGLSFVGIPSLFWGTMMGFASLIPVVGTGLVWGPAVAYLLLLSKWKAAAFLALWCGVGVTSIDTFLRPYFMREAAGMPLLYIFLSVIGGIQVFGPAGLLYGPLILSFAMVMLRIYAEEFSDQLDIPKALAEAKPPPPSGSDDDE